MGAYPYLYYYVLTPVFGLLLPLLMLIGTLVGGLALYFLFVRKPNTFSGAAARLHDLFSFRTFYAERLLKALYALAVSGIAVCSAVLLFTRFLAALLLFVLGNLAARLVFELALLLFALCRNTQEINRKLGPLPADGAPPRQSPEPHAPASAAGQETPPPVPPRDTPSPAQADPLPEQAGALQEAMPAATPAAPPGEADPYEPREQPPSRPSDGNFFGNFLL